MIAAGAFFTSASLSFAGVWALLRWWRHGLTTDVPNGRSSHTRPMPSGGGLSIVLTVCAVLAVSNAIGHAIEWRTFVIFLGGAGFVALVSWLDDVHGLSNANRLLAQGIAALNALAVFGYWHTISLPYLGEVPLSWLGLPLTFLWILGLANTFNFMDGVDGLAASQAVISGIVLGVLGYAAGFAPLGFAALVMAGAAAGFLAFNRPPAKIFMGDIGSVFLGYTFAILVVYAGRLDGSLKIPALLPFVPVVFDAVFTFLRRLRRGEDVFRSHRSHLYQRLVATGIGHGGAALLYAVLAVASGGIGLAWYGVGGAPTRALLSLAVLALCFLLWLCVVWRERGRTAAPGRRARVE